MSAFGPMTVNPATYTIPMPNTPIPRSSNPFVVTPSQIPWNVAGGIGNALSAGAQQNQVDQNKAAYQNAVNDYNQKVQATTLGIQETQNQEKVNAAIDAAKLKAQQKAMAAMAPNPNKPFNPDGSPNKAYQDWEMNLRTSSANNTPLTPPPPQSVIDKQDWNGLSAHYQLPINGEALQAASLQYALNGGKMPSLGFGKSANIVNTRLAIMQGVPIIEKMFNMTPEDLVNMPSSYKADAGALLKTTQKQSSVGAILDSFHNNIQTLQAIAQGKAPPLAGETIAALGDKMKKVDFSKIKSINSLKLYFGKQMSDPATASYLAAITTVAMDYARIMSSQGQSAAQVSDSARTEAMRLLDASYSPDAMQGIIGVLESDTAGQMKGLNDQVAKIKGRMGFVRHNPAQPEPTQPDQTGASAPPQQQPTVSNW